jgi:hypothetical protein
MTDATVEIERKSSIEYEGRLRLRLRNADGFSPRASVGALSPGTPPTPAQTRFSTGMLVVISAPGRLAYLMVYVYVVRVQSVNDGGWG